MRFRLSLFVLRAAGATGSTADLRRSRISAVRSGAGGKGDDDDDDDLIGGLIDDEPSCPIDDRDKILTRPGWRHSGD